MADSTEHEQGAEQAVPVAREPRHRLRMSNDVIRVYYVELEAGESTLLHSHAHPYVTLVLEASPILNAPEDVAARREKHEEGEAFIAPAGTVHRVRNVGETPFRNYTVALTRREPHAKPSSLMRLQREGRATMLTRSPHASVASITLGKGEDAVLIGDMLTTLMNDGEVDVYSVEGDQVLQEPEAFVFTSGITKLQSRKDARLVVMEIN